MKKDKKIKKGGEIIIYKSASGPKLEVHLERDTIWLTQKQIAEIFDVKIPAVSKHIENIYREGELSEKATVSKMEIVQTEGKRSVKRNIEFYNLDMTLSIGYRVNSKTATQFRVWATKTLKQHLIQGYTINEKRLLEVAAKLT